MSIYTPPSEEFRPTYLYIKQHSITGKLYFGKTFNFPLSYSGSGNHWTRHFKKHGKEHIVTLWYCLFLDKESIFDFAYMFCKLHNIGYGVGRNREWLNAVPETGIDAPNQSGFTAARNKSTGLISVIPCADFNTNSTIYEGPMKNTVSCIDKNGNGIRIPSEQFHNNRDEYSTGCTGFIACFDNVTNTSYSVDAATFYSNPQRYTHPNKGMTTVFDHVDKKSVYISIAAVKANPERYKGHMTGTITAFDKTLMKFVRIPKDDYYSNHDNFINPASTKKNTSFYRFALDYILLITG